MTIRGKMLFRFGLALSGFLFAAGIVLYWQSRNIVIPLTKEFSREVLTARSDEMARLMAGYLHDVKSVAALAAVRSGNRPATEAAMTESMARINDGDYEMLFFADTGGRFITTTGDEGNVGDRDYFEAVVSNGAGQAISDPVVSRASGEHVFVVAAPVKDDGGSVIGMIGATVLLETLTRVAGSVQIGESGFGYVVAGNGLLIAHPMKEWRLKLNLLDSNRLGFAGLDAIGRKMIAGETGIHSYRRPDGSEMFAVFHRINNTPGWCLGIALGRDELLSPAHRLMRVVILLMAGTIVMVLLVVLFVSKGIAAPIRLLHEGTRTVGSGNLDEMLDIRTGDEIEQLAAAFNGMKTDLKAHIENLKRTTAAKERIEQDLRVANKIQSSMLPHLFPPFPDIDNLDIYATMEPAREVGGDFYDFFLADERHLCFSIGDVSGKGVSAALFMVITRTILKNQALMGKSVSEIIRNTNDMLCTENDESMFVTVFMGMLDVQTGELEYVSAGHNPPLLARSGSGFEFLQFKPNLVLGGMEGSEYQSITTKLAKDDFLFLYTDGVTEAMNAASELFEERRLQTTVNSVRDRNARSLIRAVRSAVDDFVQGTPASDDVTMLVLGLTASGKTAAAG